MLLLLHVLCQSPAVENFQPHVLLAGFGGRLQSTARRRYMYSTMLVRGSQLPGSNTTRSLIMLFLLRTR